MFDKSYIPAISRYCYIHQKWNAIGCEKFLHDRR